MAKDIKVSSLSPLEEKARDFKKISRSSDSKKLARLKKKWYFAHYPNYRFRLKMKRHLNYLSNIHLPKYISFVRWVYVDFLRCKNQRFWGIYQYVALPGEGKTLSMVAHMERVRSKNPDIEFIIATNFNYKNQDFQINHWSDMVKVATFARKCKKCCILAVDEIHVTFDSSDYRSFPGEILALLSFNRKFNLQFLCSSQIYDRIPKKIRDIANYTVICKNVLGMDRLFRNYYFLKDSYDSTFSGHPGRAEFIREFVADDYLYSLYNTLEQVDKMTIAGSEERSAKESAFNLLFGSAEEEEATLLEDASRLKSVAASDSAMQKSS